MCTLTIHRSPSRLLVTMNRDETRARAAELPPRIHESCGVAPSWVAPQDGAAGGTWIGANDRGVIACLLNRYLPGDAGALMAGRATRGRIVRDTLAAGGPAETLDGIARGFDPSPYPSFTLLVVLPEETRSFAWDGERLVAAREASEWACYTSSSWNGEAVADWRGAEFERWRDAGAAFRGAIPSFHLLQPEGRAEWSPLMERVAACTRSVTQVEADFARGEIAMRHWPRESLAPLGEPATARLELKLGVDE